MLNRTAALHPADAEADSQGTKLLYEKLGLDIDQTLKDQIMTLRPRNHYKAARVRKRIRVPVSMFEELKKPDFKLSVPKTIRRRYPHLDRYLEQRNGEIIHRVGAFTIRPDDSDDEDGSRVDEEAPKSIKFGIMAKAELPVNGSVFRLKKGSYVGVTMPSNVNLRSAFERFCDKLNLKMEKMVFTLRGDFIEGDLTPEKAGLEEDITLEVITRFQAGLDEKEDERDDVNGDDNQAMAEEAAVNEMDQEDEEMLMEA